MSLSSLEQDTVNILSLLEQAAAALGAANNPKYSSVISSVSSLTSLATSALGVPTLTSTLPQDLVANVAPTIAAVNVITSKTATATQKAAAVSVALGAVETIGEDVWGFFTNLFTKTVSPT